MGLKCGDSALAGADHGDQIIRLRLVMSTSNQSEWVSIDPSRSSLIVEAYSINPQALSASYGTVTHLSPEIQVGSRPLNGVIVQFSEGSTYRIVRRDQEDNEAVQYTSIEQEDLP